MSETRDNKFTLKLTDLEKQKLEKLAKAYDCNQSALLRQYINGGWDSLFGETHPESFDRHDMEMGDLLSGEIEPGDVDDELQMDGESPPQIPAADGGAGAAVSPGSHTPTQTPQDLAQAGPALSWDELKAAVDEHWGPELEIHPDRVEPETLKNNQNVTPKLLAGIIRSEEDVVAEVLIEQRIEDYLGHKVTRADYEAGLAYKIGQYKPLIIDYLEAHPGTRTDLHYASPDAAEEDLPSFVTNTLESLQENQHVLDITEWAAENDLLEHQIQGKEIELWLENVTAFRHDLLDLKRVYKDPAFIEMLIDSDIDYPEDSYQDPVKWLKAVCESWLEQYAEVDPRARYAAVHTVRETDGELLSPEIDEPAEAMSAFDSGETPAPVQFAKIRDAVL
ncbi:hypothetical protein [Natrinema thermotolerans]|uniref:hypothetical protein n=1 Tax=Natrinema thermotolerans TaxID=121872 RepID=UPI000678EA07|nr:hypothetical protein [Natrinema thermotolerans]QCC57279.1 hypothetical protein DVR14_00975 [Natrinema thermotolerans]